MRVIRCYRCHLTCGLTDSPANIPQMWCPSCVEPKENEEILGREG